MFTCPTPWPVPGVRAGRRYVSSGEISESDRGQGKRTRTKLYTTVYELEFAGRGRNQGIQRHARLGSLFAPHVRSQTRVVVPAVG